MAVAFDAASSGQGTGVTSLTVSHTCSGSDRLLTVGASVSAGSPPTISGVTYNSVAMTAMSGPTLFITFGRYSSWRLIAPATGANNIVASFGGTADEAAVGGISFTGAHQTTPLGTVAEAEGTSTAPSVNAVSAADEIVVDHVYAFNSATAGAFSYAPGAGQTERYDVNVSDNFGGAAGSTETGAASTTMSHTITTAGIVTSWRTSAVGVKPAAAAATDNQEWLTRSADRANQRQSSMVPY